MSFPTSTPAVLTRQTRPPIVTTLHCPFCGSGLERVLDLPTDEPGTNYGVLRCACARYPVVEGIPILQHIEGLDKVVRFVEAKDTTRALLHAMNVFRVRWAHKSRWHQARYYLNCRRLVADRSLTFEDALHLVRQPKGFADYLFQRYANPSFMSDMALLPVMGAFFGSSAIDQGERAKSGPMVLDLACGTGHSSALMTHWFPGVSVIAADQDFVSLYVAKRFLAPAADYVCFDSEAPNPFSDDCFDAVHCLDAFHYFKSKRAIVTDLRRAVKPSGLWLFPHLHNALKDNVTSGIPLSPEHYRRCFEPLEPMLFDEADIRSSVSAAHDARLLRPKAAEDLSGAQSLALVCGGAAALRQQEGLLSWVLRNRSNLRVNPIYQGAWHGDMLKLQIRWPNEGLHLECIDAESSLPSSLELKRADLDALVNGQALVSDGLVRDLVSRFVIIPLAPRYGRLDLAASIARR